LSSEAGNTRGNGDEAAVYALAQVDLVAPVMKVPKNAGNGMLSGDVNQLIRILCPKSLATPNLVVEFQIFAGNDLRRGRAVILAASNFSKSIAAGAVRTVSCQTKPKRWFLLSREASACRSQNDHE
jgi:hypothetical protein